MTGIGGCRTSGAFTADKQITTGAGKVISIHGVALGAVSAVVHLYDVASSSDAAASNCIGILAVAKGASGDYRFAESDLHGVIFKVGLYADVTHGTGTTTQFTVEFN